MKKLPKKYSKALKTKLKALRLTAKNEREISRNLSHGQKGICYKGTVSFSYGDLSMPLHPKGRWHGCILIYTVDGQCQMCRL